MSDWVLVAGDRERVDEAARRLERGNLRLSLRRHEGGDSLVGVYQEAEAGHVEGVVSYEDHQVMAAAGCTPGQYAAARQTLAREDAVGLRSAYAFARWDHRRRELLAERDALGRMPLLYATSELGDVCACGTNGALVVEALGASTRVRTGELLAYLDALGTLSDEELLAPLRRVRAGERLRWSPRGEVRVERHWMPRQTRELTGRDAVDAVRKTIDGAIHESTSEGATPVISVSGGLDSTLLVAALAEQSRADRGAPVAAASMISREMPCFDESGALATLEAAVPVRVERFDVGAHWPLREPRFYSRGPFEGPHVHPGTYYEAAFYRWFQGLFGTRPLWTGVGSEQAFSAGTPHALRGILANEGVTAAAREARTFGSWTHLARAAVHEAIGWGEPGPHRDHLARWIRRGQARFARKRTYELTRWLTPRARARLTSLRNSATDELDPTEPPSVRTQRGTLNELIFRRLRRQALETRVAITSPFLDPRVWELGFRIAPEWKLRGGHDRAVLRLAAPASLPDELRWRPKRGLFTSAVERGLFRRELERVLVWFRAPRLADLGLIEPRAFRLAYEDAARAVDATWPVLYSAHSRDLWLAVSAELWLRALP